MSNTHVELVEAATKAATQNGLKVSQNGRCVFLANTKKDRSGLTSAALTLSEQGFLVRAFKNCNFVQVLEAPEDSANSSIRIQRTETDAELLGRVFSQFNVTFSSEGFAFLTRSSKQTRRDLSDAAEALSARGYVVRYFEGSNFIRVKLTAEMDEVAHDIYVLFQSSKPAMEATGTA